jgi:hypothetical protein
MKYSKPELRSVVSALAAIQNTTITKGSGSYADSNAPFDQPNSVEQPAYQADE